MKAFLWQLYNSLNSLTVKGKDNLDILLGCLIEIEQKIAEIEADENPGLINEEAEGE